MLEDFWKWSGITPEQYANDSRALERCIGMLEFDYPNYPELIQYGKDIINRRSISIQQMDDLLTILAIDNEDEDILDYIVDHLSLSNLLQCIKQGINHIQPNARWQLAEIISRRKPLNARIYLEKLCCDSNDYVRKRARNVLNLIQ